MCPECQELHDGWMTAPPPHDRSWKWQDYARGYPSPLTLQLISQKRKEWQQLVLNQCFAIIDHCHKEHRATS